MEIVWLFTRVVKNLHGNVYRHFISKNVLTCMCTGVYIESWHSHIMQVLLAISMKKRCSSAANTSRIQGIVVISPCTSKETIKEGC